MISVFPNPFVDDFTLSIKEGFKNDIIIGLYNIYGQKIYEKGLVEKDSKIDFSEMSSEFTF